MTTEAEPSRERLRPRILETDETGRLELNLQPPPEANLPATPIRRRRSPLAVSATGFGILVAGVIGIDLVQFVDSAFAHSNSLGVLALAAVAAGCGGAAYWLGAELRGLWRLRSAERFSDTAMSRALRFLKTPLSSASAWLSRVTLPDHFLSLTRLRAPTRL